MKTKTYNAPSGIGKTGQTLKTFGERQNAVNAAIAERLEAQDRQIQVLSAQLGAALERIGSLEQEVAALREEQAQNIQRFGRCAAELEDVEKDVGRLKLTAKLNSNAIDKLVKGK